DQDVRPLHFQGRRGAGRLQAGHAQQPMVDGRYAFWVAFKMNPDKTFRYCYTEPQGGESGQVTLTAPPGLQIRGFCHTHPQRLNSGDFGPDDKLRFQESRKVLPGIVWYLLNPFKEIRIAVDESQFPAGAVLKW